MAGIFWRTVFTFGWFGTLIWAYVNADGFGPILSQPSTFKTSGEFWKFFIPSLTGMVASGLLFHLIFPISLDLQKVKNVYCLGFGLPPSMIIFSFIGIAVTSATVIIYGEAIWDPVVLLSNLIIL